MEGITHRLAVISIPTDTIRPLAGLIVRWTKCSGTEWTIKRLKGLKVDLIRAKDGLPMLTRIRKNSRGQPVGLFGRLFRFALKDERNFGKVVQSLMAYSLFTHESLTHEQREKFLTAVRCDKPIGLSQSFLVDLGRSIRKHFRRHEVVRDGQNSLVTYRGSPNKRKPLISYASQASDMKFPLKGQAEDVLGNALYFTLPGHNALYFRYKSLYAPVLYGMDAFINNSLSTVVNMTYDPDFVEGGEIHFLQHPGGKLRSIANPHLVHQLALRPFGEAVYKVVQSLPWDCTFDQSKPQATLQKHLSERKMVHSIDLSSATDYFPLEVQLTVLKGIFGDISDISLFKDISRSYWRSPIGVLQWMRGQPLGLYPSFAAFTLSHGILLWYLNGCQHNDKFFVLGDDVVILDENLYIRYIQVLEEMSCPYSRDKSISSANLCEFAGKIFTGTTVIPQLKWTEMSNDNFLDICRQLGPRSRSLLSRRQRVIFDLLEQCVLPVGLNFNPKGKPLWIREAETKMLLVSRETEVGSLMGLSRVINQNLFGETTLRQDLRTLTLESVLDLIMTFDKKVWSVLLRLLPSSLWLSQWTSPLSPWGLMGVPGSIEKYREIPRSLPTALVLPTRETRLGQLERMLKTAKGV